MSAQGSVCMARTSHLLDFSFVFSLSTYDVWKHQAKLSVHCPLCGHRSRFSCRVHLRCRSQMTTTSTTTISPLSAWFQTSIASFTGCSRCIEGPSSCSCSSFGSYHGRLLGVLQSVEEHSGLTFLSRVTVFFFFLTVMFTTFLLVGALRAIGPISSAAVSGR